MIDITIDIIEMQSLRINVKILEKFYKLLKKSYTPDLLVLKIY